MNTNTDPNVAIAAMQRALASPMAKAQLAEFLAKDANSSFHQSSVATSGITAYDLQAPALSLVPYNTPLIDMIPRVGGGTGIQANWRAYTKLNSTGIRPGVSGGNRGGVRQFAFADYTASYKGLGAEVNTDFEAQYAAKGFDDPRALAQLNALRCLRLDEEQVVIGGNASFPLGTTPTPNLADVTTGGTLLHSQAYYVYCVALTQAGVQYGSVANGIQGQITRTNADGSSDTMGGGAAAISAEATITLGAGVDTRSITASLTTAVPGACGYAWFISTATTTEKLVAITGNPTVTITALPPGGNQSASSLGVADNSVDPLVFDGLITQAFKSGSGAYLKALGATMTGDAAGGVKEIDVMLKTMWDTNQLGPTDFLFGSQVAQDLGVKITTGSSTSALRFNISVSMENISGGIAIPTYRNKFSMSGVQDVKMHLHPNMPAGMLLAFSRTIPYPISGVGNVIQIRTRQEYTGYDWPLRSRKWENSVYVDEVLQNYFPASMGVLYDVRPG